MSAHQGGGNASSLSLVTRHSQALARDMCIAVASTMPTLATALPVEATRLTDDIDDRELVRWPVALPMTTLVVRDALRPAAGADEASAPRFGDAGCEACDVDRGHTWLLHSQPDDPCVAAAPSPAAAARLRRRSQMAQWCSDGLVAPAFADARLASVCSR